MWQHKNLFVFDIETIPDLRAAENLLGPQVDLRKSLEEYHLQSTNNTNAFIRQVLHKVVAIAFLVAEIEHCNGYEFYSIKELRPGGFVHSSEAELIKGVFSYLKELNPRLVSFNGRTFDLPVLKYRAMLYEVAAKWFYENGDKWNNYSSRYSIDWHCDLIDAFSDFGSSAKIKMQEVAALFGIPAKLNCDGSQVEGLFYGNKIDEIRDYCELDVVTTYVLYLRYMLHRGTISNDGYNRSLDELLLFMEQHSSEKPHFAMYIKAFEESYYRKNGVAHG